MNDRDENWYVRLLRHILSANNHVIGPSESDGAIFLARRLKWDAEGHLNFLEDLKEFSDVDPENVERYREILAYLHSLPLLMSIYEKEMMEAGVLPENHAFLWHKYFDVIHTIFARDFKK